MKKINDSVFSRAFDAVNMIFMCILIFVCVFPFYYMAVVSISNGMSVVRNEVFLFPIGVNLSAYGIIFDNPLISRAYLNTVCYVTLGTAINMILTSLCAYPLSKRSLTGKKFFIAIILFTMLFDGGMIPTYLLVAKFLNLKDTIWAVLLVNGMSTYNMIIMRTFFQSIPESLHEAATIDGANDIGIFTKIVIPLSKPIMATMLLFYAVAQWNRFFDYILYLSKKVMFPMQLILRSMVVDGNMGEAVNRIGVGQDILSVQTNIKYAVILITVLPILILYPFVQKFLIKGVMIGSIKG